MGWIILATVVITVGLLRLVMDSMWKRVVGVSVNGLLLACVGGLAAILWRWSVARSAQCSADDTTRPVRPGA